MTVHAMTKHVSHSYKPPTERRERRGEEVDECDAKLHCLDHNLSSQSTRAPWARGRNGV
jgi:hypothetical protein